MTYGILAKCTWVGASGMSYDYSIYPLNPSLKSEKYGNYVFAKQNAFGEWVPIYIGEGDLSDRCTDRHHQWSCIRSKGATHVHVHFNPSKISRRTEEEDLLRAHPIAYVPTGCNVKRGG